MRSLEERARNAHDQSEQTLTAPVVLRALQHASFVLTCSWIILTMEFPTRNFPCDKLEQ